GNKARAVCEGHWRVLSAACFGTRGWQHVHMGGVSNADRHGTENQRGCKSETRPPRLQRPRAVCGGSRDGRQGLRLYANSVDCGIDLGGWWNHFLLCERR